MRALLAALALLIGLLVAPPAHAAADTNLAAGRSATAGSFTDVYRAANVTDGNQATYWESANNAFPQWVQVDLGASASVSKLVLKLPSGWPVRTQTLSVQGSTNGSTFSTIAASATHTFDPAATITFGTTTTRYVRLQITANSGWPAGQLSEFEVWGSPLGNPGGGTNLALGKAMAASSHTQSYVAANANDDNVQTYWEGAAYPGTLTAQLGANADLTSITLKLNPDPVWARRTQTIQVLGREQSATAFTTLVPQATYTFDPATGNTVTIPVTAKAADVRLQITANTGAPGGQIAEFQIFGTPAANPDLTVTNLTWSPASPTATTAITLSSTVKNAGTAASAATSVNFYAGATKVGTAAVGALAAGASTSVSVNIGTRRPGTYQLSAKADEEGEVVEQNESNNTFTAPASLEVAEAPGPDLQIVGVSATPPNPAIGERVTFTVAVKNRGTSTTGATTVTRVAVGGTTLDTQTPPIAAGATANVAVGGGWTATSGGATITATADATDAVDETDEDNNTHSQQIAVGRGASVPYVEYEAESAVYQGTLLQSDPLRTYGHTNFATESSGRKSVRLNSTGQYVEFTSRNQANSIVVRNSIPDAPGGGGIEATISLYADGTFVRKLTLSSRHSWLYGTSDDPEALTNTPQADARRLFDESHALLSRSYPPGTKFRIQRDADDTAAFYIIDLIDLEQVAPPSERPAECTSITEYGAVPDDGNDDTAAIQRAVTDDQNGVINCVWIPPGQWRQEKKILTDDPLNRGQYNQVGIRNVTIRGAGMWHSQLYTLTEPHLATGSINHPHEGNFGFDIDDNVQISDLAIFGSGRIRGGPGGAEGGVGLNGRFGKNTKIANVWIEHANVGVWVGRDYDNIPELWGPADGLQFSGMRIRNTYADGINFSNGTRNSRVYNSTFRTTGDDSLAVWANPFVKDPSVDIAHDNTFVNNTIQLPWRANGIAIYGGYDNKIENNLIYDTMNYPGIMLATDHNPLPFSGQTLIAGNALHRCGGVFWGEAQKFGAITLYAQNRDITGVTIRDTDISDSTYDGIQFKSGGGNMPNVAITNVRIDRSNNGAGILAQSSARGSATLTNVTITNSATGDIVREPGSGFVINGQ